MAARPSRVVRGLIPADEARERLQEDYDRFIGLNRRQRFRDYQEFVLPLNQKIADYNARADVLPRDKFPKLQTDRAREGRLALDAELEAFDFGRLNGMAGVRAYEELYQRILVYNAMNNLRALTPMDLDLTPRVRRQVLAVTKDYLNRKYAEGVLGKTEALNLARYEYNRYAEDQIVVDLEESARILRESNAERGHPVNFVESGSSGNRIPGKRVLVFRDPDSVGVSELVADPITGIPRQVLLEPLGNADTLFWNIWNKLRYYKGEKLGVNLVFRKQGDRRIEVTLRTIPAEDLRSKEDLYRAIVRYLNVGGDNANGSDNPGGDDWRCDFDEFEITFRRPAGNPGGYKYAIDKRFGVKGVWSARTMKGIAGNCVLDCLRHALKPIADEKKISSDKWLPNDKIRKVIFEGRADWASRRCGLEDYKKLSEYFCCNIYLEHVVGSEIVAFRNIINSKCPGRDVTLILDETCTEYPEPHCLLKYQYVQKIRNTYKKGWKKPKVPKDGYKEVGLVVDFETRYRPGDFNRLTTYSVSYYGFEVNNPPASFETEKVACMFHMEGDVDVPFACEDKFMEYVSQCPDDVRYTIITFNGSRFDNFFIARAAADRGMLSGCFNAHGEIKGMNIWRHRVFDLCKLSPGRLADLCESYNVRPRKKEGFSHIIPQKACFEGRLMAWLEENREEIKDYNVTDVLATAALFVEIRRKLMELTGVMGLEGYDFFNDGTGRIRASTAASVAWDILSKMCRKEDWGEACALERYDMQCRDTVYGGRTQAFIKKMTRYVKSAEGRKMLEDNEQRCTVYGKVLKMVDVKSLYPTVMAGVNKHKIKSTKLYGRFPVGQPIDTAEFVPDRQGVYLCRVEHQNLLEKFGVVNKHGKNIIPYRDGVEENVTLFGKAMVELGVVREECDRLIEEKEAECVEEPNLETMAEIKKLYYMKEVPKFKRVESEKPLDYTYDKSFMCRLLASDIECLRYHCGEDAVTVMNGFYWENDTTDMFTAFVLPLAKMKDHEDELKELGQMFNEGFRELCKLLMNSCSGKPAQRNFDDITIMVKKGEISADDLGKVDWDKGFEEEVVNSSTSFIKGKRYDHDVYNLERAKPSHIAACIYSYARTYMYENVIRDFDIIYMDTDSAVLDESEYLRFREMHPDLDSESCKRMARLGDFEEEFGETDGTEAYFVAPKNYCIVPYLRGEVKGDKVKSRMKGVGLGKDQVMRGEFVKIYSGMEEGDARKKLEIKHLKWCYDVKNYDVEEISAMYNSGVEYEEKGVKVVCPIDRTMWKLEVSKKKKKVNAAPVFADFFEYGVLVILCSQLKRNCNTAEIKQHFTYKIVRPKNYAFVEKELESSELCIEDDCQWVEEVILE